METSVSEIAVRMIEYSEGNCHDISHLLKVWSFARVIAEREGVPEKERKTAEIAALVHDIACPLCREKYGNTNGKHQEAEGAPMVEAFLRGTGMDDAQIGRVSYLVGHHHTLTGIDGADYQILIEADYIANACENGYDADNVRNFLEKIARTTAGKKLIRCVFCL